MGAPARRCARPDYSDDHGARVVLAIEDDGAGLRPDQMAQVLRPGERLDEAAPRFGFPGLSITRELAELYGGAVELAVVPIRRLARLADIAARVS